MQCTAENNSSFGGRKLKEKKMTLGDEKGVIERKKTKG